MTKKARIEQWIADSMARKEKAVVSGRGNGDLCPIVEGYRTNHLVARVTAPEVDRDMALYATRVLISGFLVDEVWLAMDAHMATLRLNPATGEEWGPGEMAQACEQGACQAGLITDALVLVRGTRDGAVRLDMRPYHVHGSDGTVVWVEEPVEDGVDKSEGFIPDWIRASFIAPTVLSAAAPLLPTESDQVQRRIEAASANILRKAGFEVTLG